MPLKEGTSQETVSENISEMMHAGHSQEQAVAAAMRQKRESKDQGTPGIPGGMGMGTGANPAAPVIPGNASASGMEEPMGTTAPVTGDARSNRIAGDSHKVVASVKDIARWGGAKDDWSPEAREAAAKARAAHSGGGGGGEDDPEQREWRERKARIEEAKKAYANHPYYQGKEGSDTENARQQSRHPYSKQ